MSERTDATLRIDIAGGVATVTVDNPPINIIDRSLYRELSAAIEELEHDERVRVVIICSSLPEWFIAHFDVTLIQRMAPESGAPSELHPFNLIGERLRTMPKATIAVLEGRVGGGGCERAMSCDMQFAALDRAVFNQPEVALGLIPGGGGGTQRLARLVGRARALEAILGCDDIDASTAERWGWVNRALESDDLWPFVRRLAARIASFPANAIAAAKSCVVRLEKDVIDDLLSEAAEFNRTLGHQQTQATIARFLERGGQTPSGESALANLLGELHDGSSVLARRNDDGLPSSARRERRGSPPSVPLRL